MRNWAASLIGMHDYYTGLDTESFRVTADFDVDGVPAGEDLAAKFRRESQGVWEWTLAKPLAKLAKGVLTVPCATGRATSAGSSGRSRSGRRRRDADLLYRKPTAPRRAGRVNAPLASEQ